MDGTVMWQLFPGSFTSCLSFVKGRKKKEGQCATEATDCAV